MLIRTAVNAPQKACGAFFFRHSLESVSAPSIAQNEGHAQPGRALRAREIAREEPNDYDPLVTDDLGPILIDDV